MGSPDDENGRYSDEGPQHKVEISKDFWMGVTPVTQAQWYALMGKNPSQFKGDNRLVEQVSWEDSVRYIHALNRHLNGLDAHLPTEAQWEYACRAGTTKAFNNDEDCTREIGLDPALDQLGWFDKNSAGQTHEVSGKRPNAWGLYDMHGNVWEWCFDWFGDYDSRSQTDPSGPDQGWNRVLRGGSWISDARYCRSAYRLRSEPDLRNDFRGFRLAAGHAPEGWKDISSRIKETG